MPVTSLSIPQINLLLALLHLQSTVTTTELGETFGIDKVETSVRESLSQQGFISAWRDGRPFRYELSDAGALRARQLLGEVRPKGLTARTGRIIWAICNDFSSYMERDKIELADIYLSRHVQRAEPADVETRIRRAYGSLTAGPADWLPLRKLRTVVADLNRDVVDNALTAMLTRQAVLLIPEENQKVLTSADHEAAIYFGGQARHLIAIERP